MIDIRHITTGWHSRKCSGFSAHISRQFIAFTHILTDARVSLFPLSFFIAHESHSKLKGDIQKDTRKNGKKVNHFFRSTFFLFGIFQILWHNIYFHIDVDTCSLPISICPGHWLRHRPPNRTEKKTKNGEQFYDLWEKPINYLSFSTHTHQLRFHLQIFASRISPEIDRESEWDFMSQVRNRVMYLVSHNNL